MTYSVNQKILGEICFLMEEWSDVAQQKFLQFVQTPSLTKFLKSLPHIFSVQLTYLGKKNLVMANRIGRELASQYFVREVSLLLDDLEVVRARSSCLLNSEFWINFLDCGNQPIGEKFINIKQLSRDDFSYGIVSSENLLLNSYTKDNVLYRQSLFDVSGQRLILTECFLTNIEQFLS